MEDINQFNIQQSTAKVDESRYLIMETGKFMDSEFSDCGTYTNLQLNSDMLSNVSVSNHIDTSAQDFLQCVTSSTSNAIDKHYNVLTPSVAYFSTDPKEYANTLISDSFSHLTPDQSTVALTLASLADYTKESLHTFCENQPIPSIGLSSLSSPIPDHTVKETQYSIQQSQPEQQEQSQSIQQEQCETTKFKKEKSYSEYKSNEKLVAPTGYRLIDLSCLVNSLSSVLLCDCGDGRFKLLEDLNESFGYYAALKLICDSCDRTINCGTSAEKENIFEVNRRTELIIETLDIAEVLLKKMLKEYDIPYYKTEEPVIDETDDLSPPSPLSTTSETTPLEQQITTKQKQQTDPLKPSHCFYCSETFLCRKSFFNHLRKHCEKEPLKCTGCPQTFTNPSTLFKHLKVHNPSLHKCHTCGKEFKKPFNLKQHLRIHTGEKPFLCSECGKSFSDASTFRKHKVGAHSTERKLQCEICSKKFYHQGHLKEHMRTHTHERPFRCQLCNKMFTYKDSLKKHNIIHSGEMFSCTQCSKQFRWQESLRQHMKTHKNVIANNESSFNEIPSVDTNAMTPGLLLFSPNTEHHILKPSSVPFSNEIFLL